MATSKIRMNGTFSKCYPPFEVQEFIDLCSKCMYVPCQCGKSINWMPGEYGVRYVMWPDSTTTKPLHHCPKCGHEFVDDKEQT